VTPGNRRWWLQTAAGCATLARGATPPVRFGRKIRLALAGVTGHASEILSAAASLPDVQIVAASDSDPSALAAFSRRPGLSAAKTYADYRVLLDREKPDVVQICGVNGERAAAVIAAAERGMHIIAEKPLATKRPDLDRVVQAIERRGVRATMLLPMRFYPWYQAMKQIADSGEIGEVAQIDSQKSYQLGNRRGGWMFRRSSYGGTIPWAGIHMVDLMRWISGREFVQTVGFQTRIGFPEIGEMENAAASLFRLDNGGVAVLRLDFLRPETAPSHGDDRLRLMGTKGVAEYRVDSGLSVMSSTRSLRIVRDLPPPRSLPAEFLESIYGDRPAPIEWRDICRVNRLVLAARDAAEANTILRV